MFARAHTHAYQDPLERLWIRCAHRIGFEVVRTSDAYASFDGKGRILIATADQFDPDDNLGQMIFHELCHALVEGEEGECQVDWGLDNKRTGKPWREHACLRTQAWLADQYGLRNFLAPTTDYRVTFWNSLGEDPLNAQEDEDGLRAQSLVGARLALARSRLPRWRQPLEDALSQTQAIAAVLSEQSLPVKDTTALPSLWSTFKGAPSPHPAGVAAILDTAQSVGCDSCAWSFHQRGVLRCRHAPKIKLPPNARACAVFESQTALDCLTCGACCREAYDTVEVSPRDPVFKTHPEMVTRKGSRFMLRREKTRCAALAGGDTPQEPFHCLIYEGRPKTCRDFLRGSENCLNARRKVGLSL